MPTINIEPDWGMTRPPIWLIDETAAIPEPPAGSRILFVPWTTCEPEPTPTLRDHFLADLVSADLLKDLSVWGEVWEAHLFETEIEQREWWQHGLALAHRLAQELGGGWSVEYMREPLSEIGAEGWRSYFSDW